MGIFDSLIEKGEAPVLNMEYIIMRDLPKDELHGNPFVGKGEIVENVEIKTNNRDLHLGYNFEIKRTKVKSHTNYPWALAENTPENLIKIQEYESGLLELKKLEIAVDLLRKNIKTLEFKQ